MSRLLYAAARGARIQCYDTRSKAWKEANAIWIDTIPADRIHPDDEHLQYGPISTSLRKRAETGIQGKAGIPYLLGNFDFTGPELLVWDAFYGYDEKSFFLLIMAEALADMGV